jgi:HEPN domain-containing protein
MNPTAKSLILKAQDSLETAKTHLNDENQHDAVGYNLAQASEFLLKALCAIRGLEVPGGAESHDLDFLMETLENNNLAAVSSHADVIELTPYNSPTAKVRRSERLDLKEYFGHVEDLKKLVGQMAL